MYNLLLTCNNYLTGTSVAVYGSLGSVDVYGIPVSSYSIDGGNTATYAAPVIQPGGFQTRVLFYQSPPLSPGTHELVITNLNGTAPNVLWLDYILYNPSQTTSDSGGGSGSSSTSVPASTPSISQSTSPLSSASTSSNTGAIVGGVVGGLAGLAIFSALLFLCYRRRKREQIDLLEPMVESGTLYRTCFALQVSSRFLTHCILHIGDKEPEQAPVVIPFARPEERSRVNVLPMKNRAALPNTAVEYNSPSNSPSLSRSNSISQGFDPPETSALLDSQRPVIRHKDSGIRMAAPVDVPPEYTQD